MGSYNVAARRFVAKQSGPTGDTKYDIFDKAGLSRAQMRRARTTKPKRYPQQHAQTPRGLKPASTGFVPGETI